ncbi:MAG TPA: nuclear transport factor 2 family protein [Candidatus Saccharimonadia bacterium]|nr:nuclear transport factor 2 family protein [Candidatus Saccharimonadia bacterium]
MPENSNKESAVQFLKLMSSGKVDEAYDHFASPTGKHHSPYFAAGFDALKAAMKESYSQFPQKQSEVKHVVAEGDMVAIHSHVILNPGDPGFAIVHLLRFEGGKIVELWDFTQPVLADSPNADGPF